MIPTATSSPLQIQRFWTDYRPDPSDPAKLAPIDMVAYGPLGRTENALVMSRVSTVLAVKPFTDPNDVASVMSHIKADFIRAAYEAWKAGQDIPLNGTPLAAWNGLSPEQAEVFKSRSIRTVEEISLLNEATRAHIPLPNLSGIIAAARRFVDSADQTRFAAQLAEKDTEIANHKMQLQDQGEQITALIGKVGQLAEMVAAQQTATEAQSEKRKAGRPTNAELAARAAAAQSEAA
jgi:hypothetical protein